MELGPKHHRLRCTGMITRSDHAASGNLWVLLRVPWFQPFAAMLGLCYFLRVPPAYCQFKDTCNAAGRKERFSPSRKDVPFAILRQLRVAPWVTLRSSAGFEMHVYCLCIPSIPCMCIASTFQTHSHPTAAQHVYLHIHLQSISRNKEPHMISQRPVQAFPGWLIHFQPQHTLVLLF